MEKLTTIQEARLKCLELATAAYASITQPKGILSPEQIIANSEKYLDYVLEGIEFHGTQAEA